MVRFQSSVSSKSGVIPWLNPGCFRDASQIFSAYGRKPVSMVEMGPGLRREDEDVPQRIILKCS